ncbi:hypothetical protein [Edaphocola flava]|uniref:hypothetical protein n=1 Tax=Edaphocola flava TaxID=2499629 RepID=UPI00100A7A20|nr:hypothetical protein [Edaphocola flava]
MFNLGDVVYVRSDIKKKTPMTIAQIHPLGSIGDIENQPHALYYCQWLDVKLNRKDGLFSEPALIKAEE